MSFPEMAQGYRSIHRVFGAGTKPGGCGRVSLWVCGTEYRVHCSLHMHSVPTYGFASLTYHWKDSREKRKGPAVMACHNAPVLRWQHVWIGLGWVGSSPGGPAARLGPEHGCGVLRSCLLHRFWVVQVRT